MEILKKYACHHSIPAVREFAKMAHQRLSNDKIPSYEPLKDSTVFLSQARELEAPWHAGFRAEYDKLIADDQLAQEERYFVKVQVKKDSGEIKDLHEFLGDFLTNTKEPNTVLLLTGIAGSGKSLSIKHFVKESWEKGQPEGFIPIIVSLATLSDPTKAVIETLNKRSLDINKIRLLPILWIFDAVDETKEASSITQRLFTLMDLDLWLNSKVIFIARSGMSQEKISTFYPKAGSRNGFIHLDTLLFDNKKRDQYISQFSQVKKTERLESKTQYQWARWEDPQEYFKYLQMLFEQNPSLQELISTPLYLSITAKVLPLIMERRTREKSDLKDKLVDTDLLDALYCSTVAREISKKKEGHSGWEEKKDARLGYFKYALNVVKFIKKYELENKSPWIPKTEAEKLYPAYFDESNPELVMKRRCCSLTVSEQLYGYTHRTFYDYFFSLKDPSRKSEVKALLRDNAYEQMF